MNIRSAHEGDLDAIAKIYDDICIAEENGEMTVGWVRGVYPTRSTAELALTRGDLYVLEDLGSVQGAAIVNNIQVDSYAQGTWEHEAADNEVCVLHTLVISPSASGKGYGRAFVDFYEKTARESGCPELRIDTNARNAVARAMYKKLGFKEIGIIPTDFNGIEKIDLVLLEKRLQA